MDRVDWRTWFSENTRLKTVLENIEREFPQKEYALERLLDALQVWQGLDGMTENQKLELLIRAAVELTEEIAPKWEFIGRTGFCCSNFTKSWNGN